MLKSVQISINNAIELDSNDLSPQNDIHMDSNDRIGIKVVTTEQTELRMFIGDVPFKLYSDNKIDHKYTNSNTFGILCNSLGISIVKIADYNDNILYSFNIYISSTKISNEELFKMLEVIYGGEYQQQIITMFSLSNLDLSIEFSGLIDIFNKMQTLKQFLSYSNIKTMIIQKKLNTKVMHMKKEVELTSNTIIDEQGLINMVQRTDRLILSTKNDYNSINVKHKYYKATQIQINTPYLSDNIYENQVIRQFITELTMELKKYSDIINTSNNNKAVIEKKFRKNNAFNKQLLDKVYANFKTSIKELQKDIKQIDNALFRNYPLIKPKHKRIYITPLCKYNYFYNTIFKFILKWQSNNLLARNNHNDREQSSKLESIDKLFEYYCWEKLKLSLEYHHFIKSIDDNQKVITYERDDMTVRLYFSPDIKKLGEQSDVKNLHVIPGEPNTKKYTPDFIMEVLLNNDTFYWILDAKYTHQDKYDRFKEIAYKYLLGIRTIGHNGYSKIMGASILTPLQDKNTDNLETYSFYNAFPVMSRYAFNILEDDHDIFTYFENMINVYSQMLMDNHSKD